MKKLLLLLILFLTGCDLANVDQTNKMLREELKKGDSSLAEEKKNQPKFDSQQAELILGLKKGMYCDSLIKTGASQGEAAHISDSVFRDLLPPYNKSHELLVKEIRELTSQK